MELAQPVTVVKGVGETSARMLKRAGIETVYDLLYYFPRTYQDFSHVQLVKDVRPGASCTIKVQVKSSAGRYVRRGMHVTEALVGDDSGDLKLVWFNQPYRAENLKKNVWYYVSGLFDFHRNRYAIVNPSMEQVSTFTRSTARIVPIYREAKGLKSTQLRAWIQEALITIQKLKDPFPAQLMSDMISLKRALTSIHFPERSEDIEIAKTRLAFEEVVVLILASEMAKRQAHVDLAPNIPINEDVLKQFTSRLGFTLTAPQRRAAWKVALELAGPHPMNRLIEGDVGSGKTVVAAMAALLAVKAGYQAALMAPTEVLARQHEETFREWLEPFGISPDLLVGSLKAAEKKKSRDAIKQGTTHIAIGTHALLDENSDFHRLGLIVIDEQHRFGVDQRQKLHRVSDTFPHVLTMTATPIPRSLALVVYGELDVSVIDELPPGRKRVITKVVSPLQRLDIYKQIDEHINKGRQAFVVCPLIDPSDHLGIRSVKAEYDRLSGSVFKHRRIALLHGRLKPTEKTAIMRDFAKGGVDILVTTSVIEVGVNIPNANVMLIEGAERFGLAQLHQLRGRVGRSTHQSFCFVVPSSQEQVSRRLRLMETVADGFRLAEMDLKLRGPGQIYGWRQHGQLDLRIANLSDTKLIALARERAKDFLASRAKLIQCPWLMEHIKAARSITSLN